MLQRARTHVSAWLSLFGGSIGCRWLVLDNEEQVMDSGRRGEDVQTSVGVDEGDVNRKKFLAGK